MVKDIMSMSNQVIEGLAENGIDLSAMISSFFGAKAADNN
jgi:hypothetical protein